MNDNILIKNIYHMMAYAFNTLTLSQYENVEAESFDHIDDLFATLLIIGMNTQIKRGLAKGYIRHEESLKTLRGKIDLSKTLKSNTILQKELICGFDEYSENILLNKVVKTVLVDLLRKPNVKKKSKEKIKRILLYLSSVEEIDLKTFNFKRIEISRHHQEYKILIYISYLYQQNHIMSNVNTGLNISSLHDSQELHSLFENFVLSYYKIHYPEYKPSGKVMNWDSENIHNLLPVMKTDINLETENRTLIIDTKYYQNMYSTSYEVTRLLSSHVYQIYAYVSNYKTQNNKETIGMILYAKTKHEESLNIKETINGFDIYFKSIDLNKPFQSIKEELNNIAELLI